MRRWNAVRRRLGQRAALLPEPALWHKIEASRTVGSSVELPRESLRVFPRIGLYGVLLGAVLLAYAGSTSKSPPPGGASFALGWTSPLLPRAAFAQGGEVEHFPAIGPPDGSKVRSGRWVYSWKLRSDDTLAASRPITDTVTVRQSTFRDRPAWLVTTLTHRTSKLGGGRLDSLYLDASDLRPLRSVLSFYRSGGLETAQVMDYQPGLLRWQFRIPGGSGRDTTAILRLPAQSAIPLWSSEFPLLLSGLQLRKGWSGGIPLLYPRTDRLQTDSVIPLYWLNLHVAGRNRVTVPAGTFDCWRLVLSIPPEERAGGAELWVDRSSGLLIKEAAGPLSYSTAGRELVAILP